MLTAGKQDRPDKRSRHPIDVLIRDIVFGRRIATAEDARLIIQRASTVAFPDALRHLRKRLLEKQWTDSTTIADYTVDLRAVVTSEGSAIALYERRGGVLVAFIGSIDLVPDSRRGLHALEIVCVFYSADRGIMISGYQASSLSAIDMPENVIWIPQGLR